ncbi:MAG: recombinase family protein [Clostridia bacterium]|nr:recombinase family protein [Clostridia bacterium]
MYVRLSRDDELEGESYSISNQKKLLTKVAKDKGYTNIVVFCDDGISGVTMNRPEFNKMIEQIQLGKAAAVFIKDLSRLGRNYIEVGRLTEEFFPEHNIRLVSVSDNLDTEEGESELTPIKNLFNEWYARDISKKRRISNKIKGGSGIPLSPPPYGYIKDPENSQRWIVDEEAAYVVRRIFDMSYSGMGTFQIAVTLSDEKILTPAEYAIKKGIKKAGGNAGKTATDPYRWGQSTVGKILATQEYCGDVINFKTYSISYKNKKRHANDPENILVFKEVHEPIIDRTIFETIQLRRGKTRKRTMSNGEKNMFSGLLVCSDCGRNLHYHLNNRNIRYFSCPGYNQGKRKDCFSTHYVRVDFLEQVVLAEIRRLTRFACKYEDQFVRVVSDFSKQAMQSQIDAHQSEVRSLMARDKELDRIFERLYEDNLSGKITDERFQRMSVNYDNEQKDLRERLTRLNNILEELNCKTTSTEKFVEAVRKYTRVKKLTARMVTELIEHIEVHHTEKIDGVKTQKLVIYYNCIGSIEIPDEVPIPEADITMKTRKGVEVTYVPAATPATTAV